MSRLPNAPLIEVIFELRWEIDTKEKLEKCRFLLGDLYAETKEQYPFREPLVPVDYPIELLLKKPIARFRTKEDDYPLIQVGPGIITLNTTDSSYDWNEYKELAIDVVGKLFKVYKFESDEYISLSLKYLDFFPLDFDEEDAFQFFTNNLHLPIEQRFFEGSSFPKTLNIGFAYEIEEDAFVFHASKGNNEGREGVITQISYANASLVPNNKEIVSWLDKAHIFVSERFKKMTQGELYDSFQ